VVDLLRAWSGRPGTVNDMQAGQAASDPERFADARAEWWWGVRERAEAGDLDLPGPHEPHADRLLAELCAPRYFYDARGRIRVESKDSMKLRGLASPDVADAVVMALHREQVWEPPVVGPAGDRSASGWAD